MRGIDGKVVFACCWCCSTKCCGEEEACCGGDMAPTAGLIVGLVVFDVLSVLTDDEEERAGMGEGGGRPDAGME